MKNKKTNIHNKIIVRVLFGIIIFINLANFTFAQNTEVNSVDLEGITSTIKGPNSELDIFNKINKINEISSSSLERGYYAILNEKDAFRINIKEKNYYIIVWNITDDKVNVIFPGNRKLIFGVDKAILIDVNQDSKLDIKLELKAVEDMNNISNKKANIFIKKVIEEELIPSGDYLELFDVTVRLAEKEIYKSKELEAYIVFENFGEGPSGINIIYSIIDESEKEVYRGVDFKVVQTEDRVVKNFNFLELPFGKYILRTEIFYGDNQTGESEQDFEIVELSLFSRLFIPLSFVSIVIILFIVIMYARGISKKDEKLLGHNWIKW